jgi:hypothetical protein
MVLARQDRLPMGDAPVVNQPAGIGAPQRKPRVAAA